MGNQPSSLSKIAFIASLNNINEGKQAKRLIRQIRILTTCYLLTGEKEYEYTLLVKIISLHKRLSRKNSVLANLLKSYYNIETSYNIIKPSPRCDGRTGCGYGFSKHRENGLIINIYSNLFNIFGYDKSCGIKLTSQDPIGWYMEEIYKKEIEDYSSLVKERVTKIFSGMRIVEDPMEMFLEWYYN